MRPSPRIALVIDDELQRRRFAAELAPDARVRQAAPGDELLALVAARALDVLVVGVLHRDDEFLPDRLLAIARDAPGITLVGVFETTRPSIDEAADLARRLPTMSFVCRPGARFQHVIRPRVHLTRAPTFSGGLIGCIKRLPLYGFAETFALLQALHPSFAIGIPEQARALGLSRRNLERWFQGPDICSAGCFQSVCAAAEAAYLRMMGGVERQIAAVVEVLSRDGVANPTGVSRAIRSALRLGLEELRSGGIPLLTEMVDSALRTSRDPTRIPVLWEPGSRYVPEAAVLAVPVEDRMLLSDPSGGREHWLDGFGVEAWPLVQQGIPFSRLILALAKARNEPPHLVRARLVSLLGDLLVLRLIRREPGAAEAGEA